MHDPKDLISAVLRCIFAGNDASAYVYARMLCRFCVGKPIME